jgi:tRNA A37 methylthiotransferase MiaB
MSSYVDFIIFEAYWAAMRVREELVVHGRPIVPGTTTYPISVPYDQSKVLLAARFLGPSKVAQRVREGGYTCQVISFTHLLTYEEIEKIIQKFVGPSTLVGISSTFNHHGGTIQITDFMKVFFKNHKETIIGGPSAHVWAKQIQQQGYDFKYILSDYAENTVVPFLNKIKNFGLNKKQTSAWDIQSCQHRWHDSSCIAKGETLTLEISRGCIFKCKFCRYAYIGKKKGTYTRNMEMIKEELLYNYDKFKTTNYILSDDTFNDTVEKVEQWADMVASLPFKIQYATYLRADLLHRYPHTMGLLKDSGLKAVHFGIESLNPKSAKTIGKGWSGKHAREFLPKLTNEIWNGQVLLHSSIIAGLPHDTPQDWEDVSNWATDHELSISMMTLDIHTSRKDTPDDERGGASIFDRHAEDYGYEIVYEKEGFTEWKLNGMTSTEIRKLMRQYNFNNDTFGTMRPFQAMELMSLDIPLKTIMTASRYEIFSNPDTWKKTRKFVQNYVQRLLTVQTQ